MKIENQVCSIEQGKRLQELGITNKATLYHILCIVNNVHIMEVLPRMIYSYGDWEENYFISDCLSGRTKNDCYPAFTVAELGAMLPNSYQNSENTQFVEKEKRWVCGEQFTDGLSVHYHTFKHGETEAQARAAMLIWLLENKHITAEEVNTRLNNN